MKKNSVDSPDVNGAAGRLGTQNPVADANGLNGSYDNPNYGTSVLGTHRGGETSLLDQQAFNLINSGGVFEIEYELTLIHTDEIIA